MLTVGASFQSMVDLRFVCKRFALADISEFMTVKADKDRYTRMEHFLGVSTYLSLAKHPTS